jgi:hypothetical protein
MTTETATAVPNSLADTPVSNQTTKGLSNSPTEKLAPAEAPTTVPESTTSTPLLTESTTSVSSSIAETTVST